MELKETACKPVLDRKDIEVLFGIGRTRAFELMRMCRSSHGGAVPYRPGAVNAQRFFEMMGIDRAEYIKSLGVGE